MISDHPNNAPVGDNKENDSLPYQAYCNFVKYEGHIINSNI